MKGVSRAQELLVSRVTEIQIIPVRPKDGLVAFASFIFDGVFYFSSMGIYTRLNGGYRLTYPTRKTATVSVHVFIPINKEVSDAIENVVVAKYEEIMGNAH